MPHWAAAGTASATPKFTDVTKELQWKWGFFGHFLLDTGNCSCERFLRFMTGLITAWKINGKHTKAWCSTFLEYLSFAGHHRCADVPGLLLVKHLNWAQGTFHIHTNDVGDKNVWDSSVMILWRVKLKVQVRVSAHVMCARMCLIVAFGVALKGCCTPQRIPEVVSKPAASAGLHVSVSEIVLHTL